MVAVQTHDLPRGSDTPASPVKAEVNDSYGSLSSQNSVATTETNDTTAKPPSSLVDYVSQSSLAERLSTPMSSQGPEVPIGQPESSSQRLGTPFGLRPTASGPGSAPASELGASPSMSPRSGASSSPTAGTKRTANGAIKASTSHTVTAGATPRTHTRNFSLESTGSKVGDLTAQLKARLHYAMVKVQNGWETHSIDEVEQLASQTISPATAHPPFHPSTPILKSPRSSAYRTHRKPSDPALAAQESAFALAQWGQPSIHQGPLTRELNHTHPTTHGQIPVLAPAADIGSTRGRRSHVGPTYSPPRLVTASPGPHKALSPAFASPHTPARATFRELSEKAEQDAIDSLLFMSSPANSAAYPRSSHANGNLTTHSSPLRNGARHMLFGEQDANPGSHSPDDKSLHERAAKRRSLGIAQTEWEVEKMLDAMAEQSAAGDGSSDEEVVIPRPPHVIGVGM